MLTKETVLEEIDYESAFCKYCTRTSILEDMEVTINKKNRKLLKGIIQELLVEHKIIRYSYGYLSKNYLDNARSFQNE